MNKTADFSTQTDLTAAQPWTSDPLGKKSSGSWCSSREDHHGEIGSFGGGGGFNSSSTQSSNFGSNVDFGDSLNFGSNVSFGQDQPYGSNLSNGHLGFGGTSFESNGFGSIGNFGSAANSGFGGSNGSTVGGFGTPGSHNFGSSFAPHPVNNPRHESVENPGKLWPGSTVADGFGSFGWLQHIDDLLTNDST